jgi:ribonucleoside-diphosphate reductase alpha chain
MVADPQTLDVLRRLTDKVEEQQATIATLETQLAREKAAGLDQATAVDMIRRLSDRLESEQARVATLERESAAGRARTAYRKRPAVMRGRTVETKVGCGPLYITLNEDEQGRPFEVFFKLGKSGSCQQSYLEALGVAISVGLRYGADPAKFTEKFQGMRCPNPVLRSAESHGTLSCADGISQGLAKAVDLMFAPTLIDTPVEATSSAAIVAVAEPMIADVVHSNGTSNGQRRPPGMAGVGMCPKCSGLLVMVSGCATCVDQCGYLGKCG